MKRSLGPLRAKPFLMPLLRIKTQMKKWFALSSTNSSPFYELSILRLFMSQQQFLNVNI